MQNNDINRNGQAGNGGKKRITSTEHYHRSEQFFILFHCLNKHQLKLFMVSKILYRYIRATASWFCTKSL